MSPFKDPLHKLETLKDDFKEKITLLVKRFHRRFQVNARQHNIHDQLDFDGNKWQLMTPRDMYEHPTTTSTYVCIFIRYQNMILCIL